MTDTDTLAIVDVLVFSRPLMIVGGGQVDRSFLIDLGNVGVSMVGADGGGQIIAEAGFTPDAIVGDLDSLPDIEEWRSKTRVIRVNDQKTTDFQKCLQLTTAPVTIGLGLTGGRLDHTLASLSALTEYARNRRIVLVDEEDLVAGIHGDFEFTVEPGDRVSVYPMTPIEFAGSDGLEYSLKGLRLEPGGRVGTSNVAVEGAFRIHPKPHMPGPWLLVLNKKYVWNFL